MGWIYRGLAYCQLIRDVNKVKRLEFAVTYLNDTFDDAIFSDETTVQLDTHHHRWYRKEGEKPRLKPRPKHPVKVHVWVGISKKVLLVFVSLRRKWMLYSIVNYFKEH